MNRVVIIVVGSLFYMLLSVIEAKAQPSIYTTKDRKDAQNWYFGRNEGLSFINGEPVPLTNGAVDQLEGTAVISSSQDGRLLFYTNGVTVWNANHSIMSNGTDLKGDFTSSQSALIVPNPADTSLFYLFTTDASSIHVKTNDGLHYSIVNMEGERGNGEVLKKNIPLFRYSTEQISATRHCNGQDYWVVGYDWKSNLFIAYLITSVGIFDTVKSEGGEYLNDPNIQGIMQISPNGKILGKSSPSLRIIELFSFNNATGEVSNKRKIASDHYYYGLEFSPDNTKLYAGTLPPDTIPAMLCQFSIDLENEDSMQSSRQILYEQSSYYYTKNGEKRDSWDGAQLQLGPDQKIYVSYYGRKYLGVVANPNMIGSMCEYIHDGLKLENRGTNYGLPNFIDSDLPRVETTDFSFCFSGYTYYLPAGTVGTDEKISILLQCEYWGLPLRVEFESQDSIYFNHQGLSDHSLEESKNDCWIPIQIRRIRSGLVSSMMAIYTSLGNRYYVRLITNTVEP